jgi:intraflagellar transport protein 56
MVTTSKKVKYAKPLSRKALDLYDELMKRPDYDRNIHAFKACCQYALCNFKEAK